MIFDIMLPYYGDVSLMKIAVRSVLAQSDPGWRLTVVDDGKEPGVPEWFAELGDERVRYQRNESNLGPTGNYKKCLTLVDHEYLVMMGTDDVMLPNYVACVRSVLDEHPGVGMIQPGVEVIDGAGKVVSTLTDEVKKRLYMPKFEGRLLMTGEELATSLLRGCWFYFPSLVWRTDAIRKVNFREDLKIIQDLALVVDLIAGGESMVVDAPVCFQYRRHMSLSAADALAGTRFTEARNYFLDAADQMTSLGWSHAARAARRYVASRLHAATLLPTAIRSRQGRGVLKLSRHAFGPSRRSN